MALLDLEPVSNAFLTVLSDYMELVRDRTLTRKGGKGEKLCNFCKAVEHICATGEIIRTNYGPTRKGKSRPPSRPAAL